MIVERVAIIDSVYHLDLLSSCIDYYALWLESRVPFWIHKVALDGPPSPLTVFRS